MPDTQNTVLPYILQVPQNDYSVYTHARQVLRFPLCPAALRGMCRQAWKTAGKQGQQQCHNASSPSRMHA